MNRSKKQNNTNYIKLKRDDILNLYMVLGKLSNMNATELGLKLMYKLVKIKKAIEPEVNTFNEIRNKILDITKEYEMKRQEICIKHAKKDKDNNPIINNNEYVIQNKQEFEKEMKKLKEEYKEQLDKYDELTKELNDFLKEEIKLKDINKIKIDELPNKLNISMLDMEILSLIIEE